MADFTDALEPWTLLQRQGGMLWESRIEHNPFDFVAWRGNYAPYKYDLMNFQSFGSVSWDHPDPSILTLLTCPMDAHGRNALDIVVFRGRWDISDHSFRPPFFHRNSAVEFNAVIRNHSESGVWAPGACTWTPYLAAHGVSSRGYAEAIEDTTEGPVRMSDESLWIQFESTYPMKIMPWMMGHASEDTDFLDDFVDYHPGPSL